MERQHHDHDPAFGDGPDSLTGIIRTPGTADEGCYRVGSFHGAKLFELMFSLITTGPSKKRTKERALIPFAF